MDKLIFVYNADSGLLNSIKDWTHKIVSPETYPCSLCALTYDNLGMRRSWREFIKALGYEVEFLHRDELAEQYKIEAVRLPAAFTLRGGKPALWLEPSAIDACHSLNDLQSLVNQKLALEIG
jgi:hypothetical protein